MRLSDSSFCVRRMSASIRFLAVASRTVQMTESASSGAILHSNQPREGPLAMRYSNVSTLPESRERAMQAIAVARSSSCMPMLSMQVPTTFSGGTASLPPTPPWKPLTTPSRPIMKMMSGTAS